MRILLVANPTAGRGKARGIGEAVAEAMRARGATVELHWTSGPGDARARVGALAPGSVDRIVSLGGDGTLHELVNGLPSPSPVPIALVPLGTANLVARDAGIPLRADPATYARIATEGTPWRVDLLGTDGGFALANVGVGLDAEVVRAVAAVRRGGVGGYAKWMSPIARTFLAYEPPDVEVRVDGGRAVRGGAAIVQGTRSYGGLFTLAPDARMDDGRLEVTVMRRASRRDWFRLLLRAYAGRLGDDRAVTIRRGTHVEIRAERPVPVQADGDPAGTTPVAVRVAAAAIDLLRPA